MQLKQKYFILLFVIVGILFLLSIVFLSTGSDESILAEQAWWFSELGYVKSKLFTGMGQGWENLQLHYHKLFIWTGAIFIKIFGFSIYALKVIPLIFFIGFIIIFRKYFKYQQISEYFLLGLFLLVINAYIFVFSTVYRPEVILMTFGFLSYFLLKVGIDKKETRYFILGGIVAGICPLWHLNGLMFLCAGGVLLLVNKEIKGVILFSVFGLAFFSIYFIDIIMMGKLDLYFDQLFNDPNIKGDVKSVIYPFNKIFEEHKRIFRSFKEGSFTVVPLLAIIFNFRYLVNKHSGLLIYTLTLIVFLSLVAHGIRPLYSQVYYPFYVLILIYSFYNPQIKNLYKKLIPFVLIFYVVVQLIYISAYIFWEYNILGRNEKIRSFLDDNKNKLLTTESLVFNELPAYDINGLLGYRYGWMYRNLNVNTVPENDLFKFADNYNRDYIIIDKYYDHKDIYQHISYDKLEVGDMIEGYKIIAKEEDFMIFEKI